MDDFSDTEIAFAFMETGRDDSAVVTFVSKSGRIHSSRVASVISCSEYISNALHECLVTDESYMIYSHLIEKWQLPSFGKEVSMTNYAHYSECFYEDGTKVVMVSSSLHAPGRRTVYRSGKVFSDVRYMVNEYGVINDIVPLHGTQLE